ncbi:ogr/Delta-like zinc finger family protein [Escherichia coli]
MSRQFVKLYCQCTNGHCGQRFVMQLTFSTCPTRAIQPTGQAAV